VLVRWQERRHPAWKITHRPSPKVFWNASVRYGLTLSNFCRWSRLDKMPTVVGYRPVQVAAVPTVSLCLPSFVSTRLAEDDQARISLSAWTRSPTPSSLPSALPAIYTNRITEMYRNQMDRLIVISIRIYLNKL